MDKEVVLITGSNKGLGLETARQLCGLNYAIVLTSRNESLGKKSYDQLKAEHEDVFYHQLEVTSDSSVRRCAEYIKEKFGRLDVLINNAAICIDDSFNVENIDLHKLNQTLEINVIGPWRSYQYFKPLLAKSINARIVNVSSGMASMQEFQGGLPAYSVSKAALNMLTLKMYSETNHLGFKVNAVCPGWVKTDMGGKNAPRELEEGAKGIVWAATLPDNGATGGFFRDMKPIGW